MNHHPSSSSRRNSSRRRKQNSSKSNSNKKHHQQPPPQQPPPYPLSLDAPDADAFSNRSSVSSIDNSNRNGNSSSVELMMTPTMPPPPVAAAGNRLVPIGSEQIGLPNSGGDRRRERRLSRMSSGDDELRRRIWELTGSNSKKDGQNVGGGMGGQMHPEAPITQAQADQSYPFWNSNSNAIPPNTEFEQWLTGGSTSTASGPGSTIAGGEDEIGWRWDLPTYPSLGHSDDLLAGSGFHDLPPLSNNHGGEQLRQTETTYRTAFTPKPMAKPVRAKGPKDNFGLGVPGGQLDAEGGFAGGERGAIGLGGFPPTVASTTNRDAFLPREFHSADWLLDRSLNCRAKRALGSLNSGMPKGGHYYFPVAGPSAATTFWGGGGDNYPYDYQQPDQSHF